LVTVAGKMLELWGEVAFPTATAARTKRFGTTERIIGMDAETQSLFGHKCNAEVQS